MKLNGAFYILSVMSAKEKEKLWGDSVKKIYKDLKVIKSKNEEK